MTETRDLTAVTQRLPDIGDRAVPRPRPAPPPAHRPGGWAIHGWADLFHVFGSIAAALLILLAAFLLAATIAGRLL